MDYNFKDILARYLMDMAEHPVNQDASGAMGQYGPNSGYFSDPASGLGVRPDESRGGYWFTRPSDNPALGSAMGWSADQGGTLRNDKPEYFTPNTGGLFSMIGDFAKEGGLPLALSALGANYLGPAINSWGGIGGTAGSSTLGTMGAGADMADLAMGGGGGALGSGTAAGAAGTLAGDLGGISQVPATVADMAASTITPQSLSLSTIPAAASGVGGGLLDWLGTGSNLLKAGAVAAGALAGSKGNPGGQTTQQRNLDPRVDAVFGGLLNDANALYQGNKSGQNDVMRQAQSTLQGLLGSQGLMDALYKQGATGRDMIQTPAGNPFTRAGFNGKNWWGG